MGGGFLAGFEWIIGLLVVALCLRVYGRLGLKLARTGGRVETSFYISSDLMTVAILGVFLGALSFYGLMREGDDKPMTSTGVYESALLLGTLVAGIAATLYVRKVSILKAFGFRQLPFGKAIGWGALLIIAAYPLVLVSVQLMNHFLVERASTQKLIEFFSQTVANKDYATLLATLTIPVLIAPIAEEIIFRGYFYGTLKRYTGQWVAILLVSLLFAAIHVNLSSFLGLFVLAVCFTLAYEVSGSLLVPIVMHAIFNAFNLAQVFISTHWQS